MIKIILKIISVIGLLILTIFLFMAGQFPLIEGKHFLNKYIDTKFAEDYSPEKFEQIKVGMELGEVTYLIGQPLHIRSYGSNNIYQYTNSSGLTKVDKGRYSRFVWYNSMVEVSLDNIVVKVDKGWIYY